MTAKKRWIALLAAALVAVAIVTTLLIRDDDGDTDSGLMVAARTQAVNFFSLDHRHADDDVDRVLSLATGDFKKEYASRRKEIVAGVVDKKLVVEATVPEDGAALEFLDEDKAQVLVAVDVTTTTSAGAATESRYRTRVLLTRVGERWLTSGLNQVG